MFKGLGNIGSLLQQAKEMQTRMAEMQEQLGHLRSEGTAGGGMVTVVADGRQQILSCSIEPALFEDADREMIEDLVVAATNQAIDKAKQLAAEEMGKVTGAMNIPGLGDALAKFGMGS